MKRTSTMFKALPGVGLILLLVFAFVGLAQSATFFDSVFADSDWTVSNLFQGNGGTSSGMQAPGGPPGDPDTTFRKIIVDVNEAPPGGGSTVISVHTKADAVYDPGAQGAIASIDTSQDAIFLSFTIGGVGPQDPTTCPPCGPGTGVVIEQGGKFYFHGLGVVDSASWKHLAATGLTATDFFEFETGSHPDFSEAGAPIVFGFARNNSTPNVSSQTVSGIDNWTVTVHPLVLTVAIDIKPGSFPNSINPRSQGTIPVAILTTATFDATTVDPPTVRFGASGTEAAPVHAALEDVDGDGDADLVLHFNTQETGIVCGNTSASLTGETLSGQMIQGSDSVKTAGCK